MSPEEKEAQFHNLTAQGGINSYRAPSVISIRKGLYDLFPQGVG